MSVYLRYLRHRVVPFAAVIIGASVVVFVILYLVADPARLLLPLGTPKEEMDAFRHQLGLDDPLVVQYGRFVSGAVRGDFGTSLWIRRPALDVVFERLPATAVLSLLATGLAAVVGVTLGLLAFRRSGGLFDKVVNVGSYAAVSVSDIWLSLMLIIIFPVQLGVLKTGGYGLGYETLLLPLAALSLRPIGRMAQVTRSAMLQERSRPYAAFAAAKGLREPRIVLLHQLRNALPTIVTMLMYDAGRLFAGTAVVVETVFGWPGIGSLAVGALQRGDIYLVQAIVVVAAVVVASLNLLADLIHFVIDPRLRRQYA